MKFNPNTHIDPKIIAYNSIFDPSDQRDWLPYQIVFDRDENTGVVYENGPWIFGLLTPKPIKFDEIRYIVVGLEDDPIDIITTYKGEILPRAPLPN